MRFDVLPIKNYESRIPQCFQVYPIGSFNHFVFSEGEIQVPYRYIFVDRLGKLFENLFRWFSSWSERTEWKYWVLNCCQVKVMNKATVTKEPKINGITKWQESFQCFQNSRFNNFYSLFQKSYSYGISCHIDHVTWTMWCRWLDSNAVVSNKLLANSGNFGKQPRPMALADPVQPFKNL